MTKAFNEPLGVVAVDEVLDDPLRLGQALEPVEIDSLLLERALEAPDDPVALGLGHAGRRDRDPEPLHFVDPGVGDILRAPVAPDLQPARDVLAEPVEGVAGPLEYGRLCRGATALGRGHRRRRVLVLATLLEAFVEELPASNHPLFALPNVTLSSHSAEPAWRNGPRASATASTISSAWLRASGRARSSRTWRSPCRL